MVCLILFVYSLYRIFALVFISEIELKLSLKFEEDNMDFLCAMKQVKYIGVILEDLVEFI